MIKLATRELPWSEVCMHMRIAGTRLEVEPQANGMAQLWKNQRQVSFPITWGEAGLNRCATVGCHHRPSAVIEHGPDDERTREVVCTGCSESYLNRPALRAVLVTIEDRLPHDYFAQENA